MHDTRKSVLFYDRRLLGRSTSACHRRTLHCWRLFAAEMLFRGLLQAGLSDWMGPPFGWAIGLCTDSLVECLIQRRNWKSSVYAVILPFCLRGLFVVRDNLLAPIATRFTYSLFFFMYLYKWKRRTRGRCRSC